MSLFPANQSFSQIQTNFFCYCQLAVSWSWFPQFIHANDQERIVRAVLFRKIPVCSSLNTFPSGHPQPVALTIFSCFYGGSFRLSDEEDCDPSIFLEIHNLPRVHQFFGKRRVLSKYPSNATFSGICPKPACRHQGKPLVRAAHFALDHCHISFLIIELMILYFLGIVDSGIIPIVIYLPKQQTCASLFHPTFFHISYGILLSDNLQCWKKSVDPITQSALSNTATYIKVLEFWVTCM